MPSGLKPKSIMRLTAIGTTSVVIAATVSEMKASSRASAVARDIGRQRQQRAELGAGLGRRLRQLGFDEGLFLEQGVAPRRRAATTVFKLFRCAHEIRPVLPPPDRPPGARWQIREIPNQVTIRSLFWRRLLL